MIKHKSMYYPNMNLLRYLLSFGILINHFNVLGGHDIPYFISHSRIGGFFILSGFLMYPSFKKLGNLKDFIIHRARRLCPTYYFIVLLCAIFGVFLSSLNFSEYFKSTEFWKYLAANLTFLNWLCPSLPGVFETKEFLEHAVNGSLWTMKVEIALDLSVPLFIWVTDKFRINKVKTAIILIVTSIIVRWVLYYLYIETGRATFEILSRQIFGQIGYFYFGVLMFLKREWLVKNIKSAILIGAILYFSIPYIPYGVIIFGPLSVGLLFLGLSMIERTLTFFVNVNCVSYNIFLLHYPLIQLYIYLGFNSLPQYLSLAIIIVITVALAFLTNKFIDQPFTKRRVKQ